MRKNMNQEKIEKIKQRFDKIYKRYKQSNKIKFSKYWKLFDILTGMYFEEKFNDDSSPINKDKESKD
jgi:hypothetical protein